MPGFWPSSSRIPSFETARPAEAAHDWPDFGDVMSRQLQGAVMLRRMTGKTVATEKIWRRKCLSLIDASDGLLHRPATSYCKPGPDWGDASLTLYALVTAAVDAGDDTARRAAIQWGTAFDSSSSSGLSLNPRKPKGRRHGHDLPKMP